MPRPPSGRRFFSPILLLLLLLSASATGAWLAEPGTVKMYVRKRVGTPIPGGLLARWNALVVDDAATYLVVQLPAGNAAALHADLIGIAEYSEFRDEFDILGFLSFPIDARLPQPAYPREWERLAPVPPPGRDAFLLQFAAPIRSEWYEDLRAAATILGYVPYGGYVVLGSKSVLEQVVERLPIQLFRLNQPIHKVFPSVRSAPDAFLDVVVGVADVPEAAGALALLRERTLEKLRPPEGAGDRTYHRLRIYFTDLPQLAALPAVLWIEGMATVSVIPGPPMPQASSFYTLPPCRAIDTRGPDGAFGAPILTAGAGRAFLLRGRCGIPATAKAVSANLTIVAPSGDGFLAAYRPDISNFIMATVHSRGGRSRATQTILTLDRGGHVAIFSGRAGSHVVLDVSGYFD